MLGSPLARTAAFAALLTVLLVGFEQCASRDLREQSVGELDASLERTARAIAAELGDRALDARRDDELAALAERSARLSGVRVTLIDAAGSLRADSDVVAANLHGIENHGEREEVKAAAAGGVGHATRMSHTVGRTLRYVAVPAPGGGVVRVSDDLAEAEPAVAIARSHALGVIATAVVAALALLHGFVWLFHRRPLVAVEEMAAAVVSGRLDRPAPPPAHPARAAPPPAVQQASS